MLKAMPWLADSELGAARRFVRAMAEVSVVSDLCRRAPARLEDRLKPKEAHRAASGIDTHGQPARRRLAGSSFC